MAGGKAAVLAVIHQVYVLKNSSNISSMFDIPGRFLHARATAETGTRGLAARNNVNKGKAEL